MKNPLVSVIIPTYNEEKDVGFCLKSLLKQTYKPLEITVVDDGSTDKTIKIINKFKKIKLIKGEHKGPGFSRNLGAKSSKGEILVFVDADMTFPNEYIKNLISPIIKGECIGTEEYKQISSNPKNIWSQCWGYYAKENSPNLGFIFRAILKSIFLEKGGFDSKYGYADDMTLFFKYNLKSTIARNAFCYHKNPETLKEVYKQSRWIGSSLQDKLLNLPLIKYFIPPILVIIFPFAIPILSLKKSYSNRNFRIFFPWMLIFMSFRYIGTIEGLYRRIYLNKNVR
jgi:glycosyltransferase involved in cell wall biosynthesis